ncbi:hypothetical protein [Halobacillus litoralis]|uniref:Uncharacterized protein n=1 Tax=Halobacillus litoralis TaxID=45668 RepID=A0A410MJ91_9BACI|nr:hypothetical protein [Halobacillus litoralis]QAS54771.1 hypothetical protein HLI_21170 [Halobacillus litoralis]
MSPKRIKEILNEIRYINDEKSRGAPTSMSEHDDLIETANNILTQEEFEEIITSLKNDNLVIEKESGIFYTLAGEEFLKTGKLPNSYVNNNYGVATYNQADTINTRGRGD